MGDIYSQYTAAASALGYLYQIRYALFLALQKAERSPDLSISVERFDDIAVDNNGVPTEHIQTKLHRVNTGNLTDRSPDLWKTIRVWAEVVKSQPAGVHESRFTLITTSMAPDGSISACLRPTKDLGRDESQALQCLRTIALENPSDANRSGFQAFNALSSEEQEQLVSSVDILDSAPSISDTFDRIVEILRYSVPRKRIYDFTIGVEGWWMHRVIESLAVNSMPIKIRELENRIDMLREQFRRDSLPTQFDGYAPPESVIRSYSGYTFVRQLDAIGIDPQAVEWAIRDYIRAFEERSHWIRKEYVYDDDISKYETRLVEAWQPRFAILQRKAAKLGVDEDLLDAAREAFQWVELEASFPFRSVTHRYLCVGSYHILSDAVRIGWHPDYSELLSGLE